MRTAPRGPLRPRAPLARRLVVPARALAIALAALPFAPGRATARAGEPEKGAPRDVSELLRAPMALHRVPGMAAEVVRGSEVVASGVSGVRKLGAPEKVTIDDLWHLGSCTKSMTATLCAELVEEGELSWDATLGKVFPERVAKMAEGWKDVTLEELLTNRSGAPTDLGRDGLWGRLWAQHGTPTEARLALLDGVTAHPPEKTPGTTFIYSNAGFSMAGAMAERVTGEGWEDLIRKRLFEPLKITTAGFGAPGTPGKLDEPLGHRADGTPVDVGPGADNPRAIGPAGIVHMSIGDWAKYVAFHLEDGRGAAKLLGPASFRRLHVPPEGFDYAMGWATTTRPWGGGTVWTHSGSNTMWFCVAWLAPKRDFAVLVCCNRGGDDAAKAADEVASALITDELKQPGR